MRARGLPRGRTASLSRHSISLEETSLMKFASPTSPAAPRLHRPSLAITLVEEAAPVTSANLQVAAALLCPWVALESHRSAVHRTPLRAEDRRRRSGVALA